MATVTLTINGEKVTRDVENRRLLVFRDPEPLPLGPSATAYRTRQSHQPSETVSPLANPVVTVRVADLLP